MGACEHRPRHASFEPPLSTAHDRVEVTSILYTTGEAPRVTFISTEQTDANREAVLPVQASILRNNEKTRKECPTWLEQETSWPEFCSRFCHALIHTLHAQHCCAPTCPDATRPPPPPPRAVTHRMKEKPRRAAALLENFGHSAGSRLI